MWDSCAFHYVSCGHCYVERCDEDPDFVSPPDQSTGIACIRSSMLDRCCDGAEDYHSTGFFWNTTTYTWEPCCVGYNSEGMVRCVIPEGVECHSAAIPYSPVLNPLPALPADQSSGCECPNAFSGYMEAEVQTDHFEMMDCFSCDNPRLPE